jgi:hypothetical protein
MERYFGQFQSVSCRHKRGQVGTIRVCIENIICNGVFVEPYVELSRPPDMHLLGRIKRGTWITWQSSRVDGLPKYIQVLIGEQPQLDAVANEVPFAGAGQDDASAMFMRGYRPPTDSLIYESSAPINPVSDMFMRGYQPPKEDEESPHACNTTESESVMGIVSKQPVIGMNQ